MSAKCLKCLKPIDREHDDYYYCDCGENKTYYCSHCGMSEGNCPECGSKLQFHEESITKKAFFNPATRNGLGF